MRIVNATLAAVAFVLLMIHVVQLWSRFSPRARLLSFALLALLATGAYSSIEAQALGVPLGSRTYVNTVAYLWIVLALTISRKGPFYRK